MNRNRTKCIRCHRMWRHSRQYRHHHHHHHQTRPRRRETTFGVDSLGPSTNDDNLVNRLSTISIISGIIGMTTSYYLFSHRKPILPRVDSDGPSPQFASILPPTSRRNHSSPFTHLRFENLCVVIPCELSVKAGPKQSAGAVLDPF
jgi:hypothetical protein